MRFSFDQIKGIFLSETRDVRCCRFGEMWKESGNGCRHGMATLVFFKGSISSRSVEKAMEKELDTIAGRLRIHKHR